MAVPRGLFAVRCALQLTNVTNVCRAAEPYKDWNLLGALTVHKPSNIFRTGWPEHPDVKTTSTIQLGLSAERYDIAPSGDC